MTAPRIMKQKILLLFGDVFLIMISVIAAHFIRLKTEIIFSNIEKRILSLLYLLIVYTFSFYIFNLYDVRFEFKRIRTALFLFVSFIPVTFFTGLLFYFFPYRLGRGIFIISLILVGILVYLWRMAFSSFCHLAVPPRNIVFLGSNTKAKEFSSELENHPEFRFEGFFSDESSQDDMLKEKYLGDTNSLMTIVKRRNIHHIVAESGQIKNRTTAKLLLRCKMLGIMVSDSARFYEQLLLKLPVKSIDEEWLLMSNGFSRINNRLYDRAKRLTDLIFSFITLIVSLPFWILMALVIKLSTKGPVFYIQERVGKNHTTFLLIKFRTMFSDAEKGKPKWAHENDLRITPFGKFLRKTRLDELPQLFNVLKGEMSLIGPRPERKYFIESLQNKIPYYSLRFTVKPGLTGWAQVNYRYGASDEDSREKLCYDLYYIKNMSLFLDLKIILKTIQIVSFGLGR